MKLSMPSKAYSDNNRVLIFFIDLIKGKNYCYKRYLDEIFVKPPLPRGRHEKFSSIGNNLTNQIHNEETYITKERRIDKIAVHCSATPLGREYSADSIDNMHINRWGASSGCGYHYVIKLDGTIEKGRWVDYPGAHVRNYNSNTIGIVYIGGVDNKLNPVEDSATEEQIKSLNALLNLLVDEYNLSPSDVLGHREFPRVNKACPCLNMDNIRKDIKTSDE